MNLQSPVKGLPLIGESRERALLKLGLKTLKDLLYFYPRRYIDLSMPAPITKLKLGEKAVLKGKLANIKAVRSPRKRMYIVEADLYTADGQISCIWFNQPYLLRQLKVLGEVVIYGYISVSNHKRVMQPILTLPAKILSVKPIIPVYPETQGITSKIIEGLIVRSLSLTEEVLDPIPKDILERSNLVDLQTALKWVHAPKSLEEARTAKRRLAFQELFILALHAHTARTEWESEAGIKMAFDPKWVQDFLKTLSFKITQGQRQSAWEIIKDMRENKPMHRLLNGDVGSGKTVVAAMAAITAIKNNYQVALMAPTQILAEQHAERLQNVLQPFGINVEIYTGYKKGKIEGAHLIVGTHALISDAAHFQNLGLIIIDEQHRFGVRQRQALKDKNNGLSPHLLSLTATPIPRTLALAVAGELDISVLKDKPPGLVSVKTKLVQTEERPKMEEFVQKHLSKGEQAFVVVPTIEKKEVEEDNSRLFDINEKKSVDEEYERLIKVFPEFKIEKMHGKMKARDKLEIMARFQKGEIDLLVSTSVIEVGVDIQNATMILIEDADMFGLAQLHQFRGRVGRGQAQAYCFLFINHFNPDGFKRLKLMEETDDGFKLAEEDLHTRGPGQLFGVMQSGYGDLQMASLTDVDLMQTARDEAVKLIKVDPALNLHPLLKDRMMEFERTEHLE